MTVLKLRFRASTASQSEPGLFLGCRKSKKNYDMIYSCGLSSIRGFLVYKKYPTVLLLFRQGLLTMKLIQTMPARKSLATRRSRWKLHAALVVMCLLLGCVLAASPTDDVVASDVALPSRITEDAQEFALSLKPSEQWYGNGREV